MAKEQANKKIKGVWNIYKIESNKIERKNKSCPKCGTGIFMAKHSNRLYCGQCKYVEIITSK